MRITTTPMPTVLEKQVQLKSTEFYGKEAYRPGDAKLNGYGKDIYKLPPFPSLHPALYRDRSLTPDPGWPFVRVTDQSFWQHVYTAALQKAVEGYGERLIVNKEILENIDQRLFYTRLARYIAHIQVFSKLRTEKMFKLSTMLGRRAKNELWDSRHALEDFIDEQRFERNIRTQQRERITPTDLRLSSPTKYRLEITNPAYPSPTEKAYQFREWAQYFSPTRYRIKPPTEYRMALFLNPVDNATEEFKEYMFGPNRPLSPSELHHKKEGLIKLYASDEQRRMAASGLFHVSATAFLHAQSVLPTNLSYKKLRDRRQDIEGQSITSKTSDDLISRRFEIRNFEIKYMAHKNYLKQIYDQSHELRRLRAEVSGSNQYTYHVLEERRFVKALLPENQHVDEHSKKTASQSTTTKPEDSYQSIAKRKSSNRPANLDSESVAVDLNELMSSSKDHRSQTRLSHETKFPSDLTSHPEVSPGELYHTDSLEKRAQEEPRLPAQKATLLATKDSLFELQQRVFQPQTLVSAQSLLNRGYIQSEIEERQMETQRNVQKEQRQTSLDRKIKKAS